MSATRWPDGWYGVSRACVEGKMKRQVWVVGERGVVMWSLHLTRPPALGSLSLRLAHLMPFISLTLGPQPMIHFQGCLLPCLPPCSSATRDTK